MGTRRGEAFLVLVVLLTGCGQSERREARGSAERGGGAGGGVGGSAGVPIAGSSPGGGGTGPVAGTGGNTLPPLHDCDEVAREPRCPDRILMDSVDSVEGDDPPPEALEGVTDLTGNLEVDGDNPAMLEHTGCLRRVGGDLRVTTGLTSLWGLRNVEEIGYASAQSGLYVNGPNLRQDCGLLRLRRVGDSSVDDFVTGITVIETGLTEFSLPSLERVQSLRVVDNFEIERVVLPNGLEFLSGEFWFDDNLELTEIVGLDGMVLLNPKPSPSTFPQYQFGGNRSFPTCVIEAFKADLVAQGADPSAFAIEGNSAICPE